MNGWLIFLLLLAAYVGVVMILRRRGGRMGTAEVTGPFIMWRTQFGKRAIEWVAKPRRFWNAVADVGIVATWITGIAIFALLVYNFSLYFTAPAVVAESGQSPEFLIGLPGVNPLIPLWWGLAALIVALVIHEGSHGVMARVGDMRVKSLGTLWFIVPIGAFVEPDEEDLERASTRAKNRVFAAGPASNLVVALVAGFILSAAFMSSIAVANDGEGIGVGRVLDGTPSEAAGLRPGDILVELRDVQLHPPDRPALLTNVALTNGTVYLETMNWTRANETLTVVYVRDGARQSTELTLMDRYEYAVSVSAPLNETHRGKGFMGLSPMGFGFIEALTGVLESPFQDGFPGSFSTGSPTVAPGSFFFYIAYPFLIFQSGIDIFAEPYQSFLVVEGPMASLPAPIFFGLATLLYWIVWLNLMLGTFNALPAGPLDGGQMLRVTLRDRLMRRFGVDKSRIEVERAEMGGLQMRGKDEETQAKLDRVQRVQSRTTWTIGLFVLMMILLPLFGPGLLKLFL